MAEEPVRDESVSNNELCPLAGNPPVGRTGITRSVTEHNGRPAKLHSLSARKPAILRDRGGQPVDSLAGKITRDC